MERRRAFLYDIRQKASSLRNREDSSDAAMKNNRPPFFCPKCGKEVGYTYDANTGRYTPAQCGDANCSKAFSAKVN
jgi:hypothetical protein